MSDSTDHLAMWQFCLPIHRRSSICISASWVYRPDGSPMSEERKIEFFCKCVSAVHEREVQWTRNYVWDSIRGFWRHLSVSLWKCLYNSCMILTLHLFTSYKENRTGKMLKGRKKVSGVLLSMIFSKYVFWKDRRFRVEERGKEKCFLATLILKP